ncbi:hypothetical protein ONS95_002671 [Cadophora gregata]|uniref:uncharacterized protein n=1 Tax=Cadophora gregata TaxID=51156 RepID=UPI0026DB7542|nr:uncharacterized protein ONS95_002671 [Cadophora gregata]KAK0110009.1 hypothetical protein ONS95_002671 [Cadophora gregata]KAK0110369.1 hypothetical protein ONS96_001984 [Cadophora gregata f. sp. sojae]
MSDSSLSQPMPSSFAQQRQHMDFLMDLEVMQRLRWPLFGPKEDIMVAEGSALHPLLDTERPHPLADQPATTPPRARMLVQVAAIATWDYWQDSGDTASEPTPLIIENEDGHAITIGELVGRVHQYLTPFEILLRGVFGLSKTGPEKFHCAGFQNVLRYHSPEPDLVFQIEVDYDSGIRGIEESSMGAQQQYAGEGSLVHVGGLEGLAAQAGDFPQHDAS